MAEAKKVTVKMSKESFVPPPRRIDDILSVLDQSAQDDLSGRKKFREEIEKPPPQTDNQASLSVYYNRRGHAFMQLGLFSEALADLRLAMTYASSSDDQYHKLLFWLSYAEFGTGNFKAAIELMERSLRVKERPVTYKGLVKLYARVGDLEAAQRAANRGISLCDLLRKQKGGREWPIIHAAAMKAMVLEAQGKFAEA